MPTPSETINEFPLETESQVGLTLFIILVTAVMLQFIHTLIYSRKRYGRIQLTRARSIYYAFLLIYLLLIIFVFSLMLLLNKQNCFLYAFDKTAQGISCFLFISAFTVCLFDYYDHRSAGNPDVMKHRFLIPGITHSINIVFLIALAIQVITYMTDGNECDPTIPNRSVLFEMIPITIIVRLLSLFIIKLFIIKLYIFNIIYQFIYKNKY